MQVTCPNCQTTFNIPDAAYVPGRKARCSHCSFVFPLPEAGQAAAVPAAPAAPVPPVPPGAPAPKAPQAEKAPASFETVIADAVDAPDSGAGDLPLPAAVAEGENENAAPRRKKRLLLPVLVGILVLAILGGGGFFAYTFFFSAPPETTGGDAPMPVSGLELSDMRQFVVTNNEKISRIVVVEGKVTNLSERTKELVIIEASLFDKFGSTLAVQQQYCGITLSLFQLQILGQEEITAALQDQGAIIMNNTNILPGASVSFTTVFFNPPQATYEFIVRIVDAQDAATEAP